MTVLESNGEKNLVRRITLGGQHIPNVVIFLKRTATEFLQVLFSTRTEGNLHYDQDDSKTNIQICDQHAVNLEGVDVRPAIVCLRGPLSWQPIGLGGSSVQERNMKTGSYTLSYLLNGSVAFSCFSREGIEAENIAHLVFNSFIAFKPVLKKYGYFSIQAINIGAETLIKQEGENDDLYMVPVYITASVQDRWKLEEKTFRVLQDIIVETLFKT